MDTMKKLFALALALALVLSLALPAMAAQANPATGTLTVTNTTANHDYKLYKLLDLSFDDNNTPDNKDDDKYAWYLPVGSPWHAFLTGTDGQNFVTVTPVVDSVTEEVTTYVVAGNDGSNVMSAADFALAAITWVKDYEKDHTAEGHKCLLLDTKTAGTTGGQVVFSDLTFGYYLVDSSVGAWGILQPLNADLKIADKNDPPTPEKEVKEVSQSKPDGIWDTANDTHYGQPVEFHIDFQKKAGAQNYEVHDDLDPNLELVKDSIMVYTITENNDGTVTGTGTLTPGTLDEEGYVSAEGHYGIWFKDTHGSEVCDLTLHPTAADFDCDFSIRFKNSYIKGLTDGQWIRVSYKAVLKPDAPVDVAMPNKTVITYGDKGISVFDQTETFTHQLRIFKYEQVNGDESPLAGAKFRLLDHKSGAPIQLIYLGEIKTTTVNGEMMVPTYRVATDAEITASQGVTEPQDETAKPQVVTEFTTTENIGRIGIFGLDSGLFILEETEAPEGFNILTDKVVVWISGHGDAAQVQYMMKADFDEQNKDGADMSTFTGWASDAAKRVSIENKAGAALPETGGTGTTMLYIAGTVMVLAALVLLVTKRRMSAN